MKTEAKIGKIISQKEYLKMHENCDARSQVVLREAYVLGYIHTLHMSLEDEVFEERRYFDKPDNLHLSSDPAQANRSDEEWALTAPDYTWADSGLSMRKKEATQRADSSKNERIHRKFRFFKVPTLKKEKFADAILIFVCSPDDAEMAVGDLLEGFEKVSSRRSAIVSNIWFVWEFFLMFIAKARKRIVKAALGPLLDKFFKPKL